MAIKKVALGTAVALAMGVVGAQASTYQGSAVELDDIILEEAAIIVPALAEESIMTAANKKKGKRKANKKKAKRKAKKKRGKRKAKKKRGKRKAKRK